jgi:TonB family protein
MLKARSSSYRCCILVFLSACLLVPTLHGQSNETDLRTRLMGKPLYLRGGWRDDYLNFDFAGQLKESSDPISFTLSGFELRTLHVEQTMLVLEGRRVGLELKDNKQLRVPLNAGKQGHQKDESMRIVIAASPSGDYGPALDAIFADGLSELVPSLPFYWKSYAAKNFLPAIASATPTAATMPDPAPHDSGSPDTKPRRIGGGVKPPKLLRSKEPEFNDAARGLNYSGIVLINLWLHPDGTVSHLSLVRALGLGLDERALAAVQKYTFAPAIMNDTPVLVELNLEVNFQIF